MKHKSELIREQILELFLEKVKTLILEPKTSILSKLIVAKESTYDVQKEQRGYNFNIILIFSYRGRENDWAKNQIEVIAKLIRENRDGILSILDTNDKLYFECFIEDVMFINDELN